MLRPKPQVLPDSALVKTTATHVISEEQPYYLKRPGKTSEPAGNVPAGSQVFLLSKGRGEMALVQDTKGRRIYTASAGLRPIGR